MIIGGIVSALVVFVTDTASNTVRSSIIIASSGHGAMMPYRASFPLYGKLALYRAPGVAKTIDATHLSYAQHEDGTVSAGFGGGTGTVDLGTRAGLWSIYSASATWTLTDGPAHTETYGFTIAGVTTNITVDVMGLTLAPLSTTFAPPHNVSTQRAFATSGPLCASRSPLILPQAHAAYTTPPNGEFAAWLTSSDAGGVGSASGTIRADSIGSSSYAMFGGGVGVEFRFNCGGVYDAGAGSFDPASHPMTAAPTLSLLRG